MVQNATIEFPSFKAKLIQYKGQSPRTVYKYLLRTAYESTASDPDGMVPVLELMKAISCSQV